MVLNTAVKTSTKVAVEVESTEGSYTAPTGATSFIQPMVDGITLEGSKELIDRKNLTSTIGYASPRVGQQSVTCSLPVEFKAHGTEGSAPQYGKLIEGCLGDKRNSVEVTSKAGTPTTTVIPIADADIAKFAVGDIVLVKEAGAYHVSPIKAKVTTLGSATIELLVAAAAPFTSAVKIAAFQTYFPAQSGHPSFSVSKYVEDLILDQAAGCKVTSMALSNFSTSQLPQLNFKLDGLSFDRSETAPSFTPSYDAALPPIVLSACVYIDGVEMAMNQVDWSVENAQGFVTSTCSANGKISSRVTSRKVSGSINPYKLTDNTDMFDKFTGNTPFSIFSYAYNPTSTAGEFEDVIAFYLPCCIVTAVSEADKDGVLQDQIAFTASGGAAGSDAEIFVGFI